MEIRISISFQKLLGSVALNAISLGIVLVVTALLYNFKVREAAVIATPIAALMIGYTSVLFGRARAVRPEDHASALSLAEQSFHAAGLFILGALTAGLSSTALIYFDYTPDPAMTFPWDVDKLVGISLMGPAMLLNSGLSRLVSLMLESVTRWRF